MSEPPSPVELDSVSKLRARVDRLSQRLPSDSASNTMSKGVDTNVESLQLQQIPSADSSFRKSGPGSPRTTVDEEGIIALRSRIEKIAALKARVDNPQDAADQESSTALDDSKGTALSLGSPRSKDSKSTENSWDKGQFLQLKARAERLAKRLHNTSRQGTIAPKDARSSNKEARKKKGSPGTQSPKRSPSAGANSMDLSRFLPSSSSSDSEDEQNRVMMRTMGMTKQQGVAKLETSNQETHHEEMLDPADAGWRGDASRAGARGVAPAAGGMLSPKMQEPDADLVAPCSNHLVHRTQKAEATASRSVSARVSYIDRAVMLAQGITPGAGAEVERGGGAMESSVEGGRRGPGVGGDGGGGGALVLIMDEVALLPPPQLLVTGSNESSREALSARPPSLSPPSSPTLSPALSPQARQLQSWGLQQEAGTHAGTNPFGESPPPGENRAGKTGGPTHGSDGVSGQAEVGSNCVMAATQIAHVFPDTPIFPSWSAISKDSSLALNEQGLFSTPLGAQGSGFFRTLSSCALPATPLHAKTELVTLIAELMANKEHRQGLSLSLSQGSVDDSGSLSASGGGFWSTVNGAANRSGDQRSMASVSKAIVAVEMARLAVDPREHMVALIADLQGTAATGQSFLAHRLQAPDDVTERCLNLLSIAYPSEFSIKASSLSAPDASKSEAKSSSSSPMLAGGVQVEAVVARESSISSAKLSGSDAASFFRSRFGNESHAEQVTPGNTPTLAKVSDGYVGDGIIGTPLAAEHMSTPMALLHVDNSPAADQRQCHSMPLKIDEGALYARWEVKRKTPAESQGELTDRSFKGVDGRTWPPLGSPTVLSPSVLGVHIEDKEEEAAGPEAGGIGSIEVYQDKISGERPANSSGGQDSTAREGKDEMEAEEEEDGEGRYAQTRRRNGNVQGQVKARGSKVSGTRRISFADTKDSLGWAGVGCSIDDDGHLGEGGDIVVDGLTRKIEEEEEEEEEEEAAACTSPTAVLVVPAICALAGLGTCVAGVVLVTMHKAAIADADAASSAGGTGGNGGEQQKMQQMVVGRWLETLGAAVLASSGGGLLLDCAMGERGGAVRVLRYAVTTTSAAMGLAIRGASLAYQEEERMLVLGGSCLLVPAALGFALLLPLLRYKRAARFGHGWFFGQSVGSGSIHSLALGWAVLAYSLGMVVIGAGLAAGHVSLDRGALLAQSSPAMTQETRELRARHRRTLTLALTAAGVGALEAALAVGIGAGVSVPLVQDRFYTRAVPALVLLSSTLFFTVYTSLVFLVE